MKKELENIFSAPLFALGDVIVRLTDKAMNRLPKISESSIKGFPGITLTSRTESGILYPKILEVADPAWMRFR